MKLLLILILPLLTICSSSGKELPRAIIEKELTAVIKSLHTADIELLLRHTRPQVLENLGGEELFNTVASETVKMLKDGGVTFSSVKFGDIYSYYNGTQNEFFLMDLTLTLEVGGEKSHTDLTQIAVKELDSEVWKYIDSIGFDQKSLREMFPELSPEFITALYGEEVAITKLEGGEKDQTVNPHKVKLAN